MLMGLLPLPQLTHTHTHPHMCVHTFAHRGSFRLLWSESFVLTQQTLPHVLSGRVNLLVFLLLMTWIKNFEWEQGNESIVFYVLSHGHLCFCDKCSIFELFHKYQPISQAERRVLRSQDLNTRCSAWLNVIYSVIRSSTNNRPHSINIWYTITNMIPLHSVHPMPSYEPSFTFRT